MNTTNRACNLECVQDTGGGEVVEFVGPVKIVLVDEPPNLYRRRIWGAAFIVLAYMLMGATTMTVLFYALTYRSKLIVGLHVFFCTVGYQLFVPCGILSLNKQSGSAAPMRQPDRQYEHMFLQLFGLALCLVSAILLFLSGIFLKNITVHSFLGYVATGFGCLASLTGLGLYLLFRTEKSKQRFKRCFICMGAFHMILGTVTFVLSSLCFIFGIWRPRFEKWVPVPQMIFFLFLFCIFYTVIVLYRPIVRYTAKVF